MSLPITLIFGALGAILASFVGVIAERAHTGQSWGKGRSKCNSCRHTLGARDLVPVFSWALNAGRCRQCGSRLPGAYALYEIALGVAFAAAYHSFGLSAYLFAFLLAVLVLAFIVIYDLRHTLVPLSASLSLIAICAAAAVMRTPSTHALMINFMRAACIALFFFLLYFGSKGRAMGLGDTPVAFALSLLAGSAAVPGLLFSFWIGAVIGIIVLVLQRGGPRMGVEVPFVPFMALGFLLAIFTQWNPLTLPL